MYRGEPEVPQHSAGADENIRKKGEYHDLKLFIVTVLISVFTIVLPLAAATAQSRTDTKTMGDAILQYGRWMLSGISRKPYIKKPCTCEPSSTQGRNNPAQEEMIKRVNLERILTASHPGLMMIRVVPLLFIACTLTLSIQAAPLGPMIIMIGNEYGIYLTDDMTSVLNDYDPEFTHWRPGDYIAQIAENYRYSPCQAPFAVVGDLNGDGVPDAVIDGHDRKQSRLLCVLSQCGTFTVMEISRSRYANPGKLAFDVGSHKEYGISRYMTLINRQTIQSSLEKEPLILEGDAALLTEQGKGSQVLYLKKGQFLYYRISN